MRKKSEFTIVERALQTVEGFSVVFKTLQQQVTIRGQCQSTLNNYIRRIALICLLTSAHSPLDTLYPKK